MLNKEKEIDDDGQLIAMLCSDMSRTMINHSCNSVLCDVCVDTLVESCKRSDSNSHNIHLGNAGCVGSRRNARRGGWRLGLSRSE